MEKKVLEMPLVKVAYFKSHDVIATSNEVPDGPGDYTGGGADKWAKGRNAIVPSSKVSWD